MSAPRRIVPGSHYLITRRTTQRLFMLRPDPRTQQIFEFCLALAAWKYPIDIIAWLLMSNHYHLVVFDKDGTVPVFTQYLNRLLASCFNELYERKESFWAADELCLTLLATEDDVLEKVAYTLANPVTAKLVDRVADWPGSSSLRFLDGKARVVHRPDIYFKEDSKVIPETVELALSFPRGRKSFADWSTSVQEKVAETDKQAAERRAVDPHFRSIGIEAVLATKPTDRPQDEEKDKAVDEKDKGRDKDKTRVRRRKLRPRVACRQPEVLKVALIQLKGFYIHHDEARKDLEAEKSDVVFPVGTYRKPPGTSTRDRDWSNDDRVRKYISRIPSDDIVSTAPFARAS